MQSTGAPALPTRRQVLSAAASTAALGIGGAAGLAPLLTDAAPAAPARLGAGARISADFEPVAAMWLGYDAGHEAFTADLAAVLAPHVALRMLVRDAPAQEAASALLRARGLDPDKLRFVHDPRAPYFVRDAAVFGAQSSGRPFIVDFRWTYYGWSNWCRRTFTGRQPRPESCARANGLDTSALDRRFGDALGLATFQSPLAIEGGGVEVNGQGLLIANADLWRGRNPGLARAAMEREMLRLPGIRKVIWLPRGLAHDTLHRATITGPYVGWGTGGHTDEFVRFADARTVLLAWVDEAQAARHPVARINLQRMQANFEVLSASTDADGRPLSVIKVPLPRTIERRIVLSADADTSHSDQWSAATFPAREGRREGDTVIQVATSSYLNHVLANDLVLLPDYVAQGTPPAQQQQVRAIYERAFAGRRVEFIDAIGANWVGGGAHCATLSEPVAGG